MQSIALYAMIMVKLNYVYKYMKVLDERRGRRIRGNVKTVATNRVASGWKRLAKDAQAQPIRVSGGDSPEVVVMSAAKYDAMREVTRQRFFESIDRMRAEAKANGLTDEILEDLLADED